MNEFEKFKQMKSDYLAVFSGDAGSRVLKDLRRYCYYNRTTIDKDPVMMAFKEGQRSVILHIHTVLNMDLEKVREQIPKGEKENV